MPADVGQGPRGLRWLDRWAQRRLDDGERLAREAFRRDFAEHWHPVGTAQRRLARRSWLVHVWSALFDGEATLAQVGAAGAMAAAGTAVLTLAPAPHSAPTAAGTPTWVGVVLAIGIVGLAVECTRSPRRVSAWPFVAVAGVPCTVGAFGAAATVGAEVPPDHLLRIGVALAGAGMLLASIGAVARRPDPLQVGLWMVGAGMGAVAVGDGVWGALHVADGDTAGGVGSAVAAAGAVLMANGLIQARPALG